MSKKFTTKQELELTKSVLTGDINFEDLPDTSKTIVFSWVITHYNEVDLLKKIDRQLK